MYSMTGFGKGTFALDGREMTVELKSVNNRFLDISMRLPRILSPLEDTFRHALQDRPLLLRRQAVLFFIAFKAGFDLCCHVEHLLYDAIIQALPKRNLKETL